MDIYSQAIQLLLDHPQTQRWPQLQETCTRALGHKPIAWDFPLRACRALGGTQAAIAPAIAALTCAHMSLILVDDLLDEDPRGAYHQLGVGQAANLAQALFGLALDVLETAGSPSGVLAAAAIGRLQLHTAYGQDLDAQNLRSEEAYWQVARAKSSPYFATGLYLGALFAGAEAGLAKQLHDFGALFGEMLQIHDDLNDCLAVPANVDWLQGRAPLPILYAELAPHAQQARFMELRGEVSDPAALQEAQSILVSSGAISYCVSELVRRHSQAGEQLAGIPLRDSRPLEELLDQMIAPVRHLFERVAS
ncbi:MAG: polyprenyl synthetase family protein [Anaerolineales bacterium]|nr:polyprenyl synthetase family protein [Anaerolineales bacterium]